MRKDGIPLRIYAIFAYNVYYTTAQNSPHHKQLPVGWDEYFPCPKEFQQNGYYGTSYIKKDGKQITLTIAHRGTDDWQDIKEDIELWLLTQAPRQYFDAVRPYLNKLFNKLMQDYPVEEYKWDIHVTGHSLGALLTGITVADNAFYFGWDRKQRIQMRGIPFETTGEVNLINDMINHQVLPRFAAETAENNLAYVKTRPDAVTTVDKTYSPAHVVPIQNIYPPDLTGYLPLNPSYVYYLLGYTAKMAHPMIHIADWLEQHPEVEYIEDLAILNRSWPLGINQALEEYKTYSYHQDYWQGYIGQLWSHNGILSTILQYVFSNRNSFEDFYLNYILYFKGAVVANENLIQEHFNADDIWQGLHNRLKENEIHSKEHLEAVLNQFMAPDNGLTLQDIQQQNRYKPSAPPLEENGQLPPSYEEFMQLKKENSPPSYEEFERSKKENSPPSYYQNRAALLLEELETIQLKTEHLKQKATRKDAIGNAVAIAKGRMALFAAHDNDIEKDKKVLTNIIHLLLIERNAVKIEHENQFLFLGLLVGKVRQSRTVNFINQAIKGTSREIWEEFNKKGLIL